MRYPILFVTGADHSHELSALRLIRQLRNMHPNSRVLVWDLGMTDKTLGKVGNVPGVSLKKYNFSDLPPWRHMKNEAGSYAWKPDIISMSATSPGIVFWLDAGSYLLGKLSYETKFVDNNGIYITSTDHIISDFTHPATIDIMKGTAVSPGNMFFASVIGFDTRNNEVSDILKEWQRLSLNKDVICPSGSTKEMGSGGSSIVHRYDQSILSIILHKSILSKPLPADRRNWAYQCDIESGEKKLRKQSRKFGVSLERLMSHG